MRVPAELGTRQAISEEAGKAFGMLIGLLVFSKVTLFEQELHIKREVIMRMNASEPISVTYWLRYTIL